MNLRVTWNAGSFLTSCRPVSFSRRTLHHGVSKSKLFAFFLDLCLPAQLGIQGQARIFRCIWERWNTIVLNPLTPNDPYSVRTAPLTSKRCILYIYSTNIGTEYFKHGMYCPFFSLRNAVCFIILTYLVPAFARNGPQANALSAAGGPRTTVWSLP